MSERGSKSKIKYIVICFILALAFPFSSLAVDSLSLNESQFSLIWNAQNWNYFVQKYPGSSGTISVGYPGTYQKYYMYDSSDDISYNGLTVYGRQFNFSYLNTTEILLSLPLSLQNIESFQSDFFLGLWSPDLDDLRSYISGVSFTYSSSSGSHLLPHLITFNNNYLFNPEPSTGSHGNSLIPLRRYNIFINENYITRLFVNITLRTPLPTTCHFFCGMASDTEIGAQDGQQQLVINGLNGIQGSIDGLVSDLQENDGKILNSLGNLEYILEGDAVTSAEADQLVQDSLTKGDELAQLGDALASVPKPDINSVTSVIKPETVLLNNDPASVQFALSSIYSWDKLLAILGVLVAVFSISYILFGKKK